MSESELPLVPTDDLVEELLSRFDHAAFVGLTAMTTEESEDDETVGIRRSWKGNSHTVMGLLADSERRIGEAFERKTKSEL